MLQKIRGKVSGQKFGLFQKKLTLFFIALVITASLGGAYLLFFRGSAKIEVAPSIDVDKFLLYTEPSQQCEQAMLNDLNKMDLEAIEDTSQSAQLYEVRATCNTSLSQNWEQVVADFKRAIEKHRESGNTAGADQLQVRLESLELSKKNEETIRQESSVPRKREPEPLQEGEGPLL